MHATHIQSTRQDLIDAIERTKGKLHTFKKELKFNINLKSNGEGEGEIILFLPELCFKTALFLIILFKSNIF